MANYLQHAASGALAIGLVGSVVQMPAAHAGLGTITISETSGVYSLTVTGADLTGTIPANFSGIANPFNYKIDFLNAPNRSMNAGLPYAFRYVADSSFDFVNSLTGSGFLSGSFNGSSAVGSTLKIFNDGLIELALVSTGPTPPTGNCYFGLTVVNAISPTNCSPYLNTLNLSFNTGKSGFVPAGGALASTTTLNSLLSNFIGSYSSTSGSFSAGGGESQVTYSVTNTPPVPGPAPLLGAAAAFRISRRIRRRIQQSDDNPAS